MDIRLSKNFTLAELTRSNTAAKLGLSNTPSPEDIARLKELCVNLLQPIRDAWGDAINVTSGFRGFRLNQAVKGSKSSAHCRGYAADVVPANGKIRIFKIFVKDFLKQHPQVPFDQCIDEYRSATDSSWVHLGYANSKNLHRRQFLISHS